MSVTRASHAPPPPLPSKGPPLPPRNGALPPLPPSARRVSAPSTVLQRDLPPPPPRRNASLPDPSGISEFEAKFRFHPVSSLPPPEPFSEGRKTYPSQMQHTIRNPAERDPLPPPPSQPPPPPPR